MVRYVIIVKQFAAGVTCKDSDPLLPPSIAGLVLGKAVFRPDVKICRKRVAGRNFSFRQRVVRVLERR